LVVNTLALALSLVAVRQYRSIFIPKTFDPKTGALKLEGEGPGRDGVMTKWVIDGRLVDGALMGDYAMGNDKGGFRFTKR